MNSDPQWTDIVVALVAGAAFVLSLVGLILQWVSWHHSGPRVSVEVAHSFIAWSAAEPQHVLAVTARNSGRAAAQVTQWWLDPVRPVTRRSLLQAVAERDNWVGDGMSVVIPNHVAGSAPLPATLEASSSLTWWVAWDVVEGLAEAKGYETFRPGLALGSGKEVRGDGVLRLPDSEAEASE